MTTERIEKKTTADLKSKMDFAIEHGFFFIAFVCANELDKRGEL